MPPHLDDLSPRRGRGRAVVALVVLQAAALLLSSGLPRRAAAADQVHELSVTLESDRDEKARIAAAVALGRLADRRGVPALIRALDDRSAVVRGVAATALGHIGDRSAIPALERALADPSAGVRARVREALDVLRRSKAEALRASSESGAAHRTIVAPKERPRLGPSPRAFVTVKSMANQTRTGGKALSERMRALVIANLEGSSVVTTDPGLGAGKMQEYVVDGSITELSRSVNGPWVEVACKVRLAISTPEGKILSMVSGGATVQTPRSHFRPSMERGLVHDALENAVRGAYQNLIGFLGRQLAAK